MDWMVEACRVLGFSEAQGELLLRPIENELRDIAYEYIAIPFVIDMHMSIFNKAVQAGVIVPDTNYRDWDQRMRKER